jgi:hypothetical protein
MFLQAVTSRRPQGDHNINIHRHGNLESYATRQFHPTFMHSSTDILVCKAIVKSQVRPRSCLVTFGLKILICDGICSSVDTGQSMNQKCDMFHNKGIIISYLTDLYTYKEIGKPLQKKRIIQSDCTKPKSILLVFS